VNQAHAKLPLVVAVGEPMAGESGDPQIAAGWADNLSVLLII
jgi:hypothetical protein